MSFVTVGSAGDAPTFFEMVAAERLMPSLKSAVIYAISVYAQRSPHLLRLLDHEEELFFLISVFLERNSLNQNNASFAESLYALQRIPSNNNSQQQQQPFTLSNRQRINSLMLITLLPYLKSKLDKLYFQEMTQRSRPGSLSSASTSTSPSSRQQQQQYSYDYYKKKLLDVFIALYPFINAAHEGTRFFYQLLYLLRKTQYYSPELHLLGLIVTRVTGQQAMAAHALRERRKQERLNNSRRSSNFILRAIRSTIARMNNIVSEHTRSALVLAVFAFKLLEWYYTSLEQRMNSQKMIPPPPPPPAIAPSSHGIGLPKEVSICPLCRKSRTNPAMVSTSGYVYCYPCIYRFVERDGCCPVTRMPARVEHIRRLYQTT